MGTGGHDEPSWPFGTGGRCGDAFAASRHRMVADMERLGVKGAHDLWVAEGLIGKAIAEVLSERDWERMQRAFEAGSAAP